MVWSFILSPDAYGLVNSFLLKTGFISTPLLFFQDSGQALVLVILVAALAEYGSRLSGLSPVCKMRIVRCMSGGAIDGIRSRWQELWYITLPQMKPMLLFGAVTADCGGVRGRAGQSGAVRLSERGLQRAHDTSARPRLWIHRYQMGYAGAVCVVLFLLVLITYKLADFALSRVGR